MIRPASHVLRAITLIAGLLFQLMPLPDGVDLARPYLLALFLCYWLLETPERTGMGTAFIYGLLADLFSGGLLGEQALRLVMLAFIVSRFRARLRFFPLWQQSISILALLLNDRLIMVALHWMMGDRTLPWVIWLSPLIGMIIWPWLFVGLDVLRMRERERK
jgi:rod shape-determining protein MreD